MVFGLDSSDIFSGLAHLDQLNSKSDYSSSSSSSSDSSDSTIKNEDHDMKELQSKFTAIQEELEALKKKNEQQKIALIKDCVGKLKQADEPPGNRRLVRTHLKEAITNSGLNCTLCFARAPRGTLDDGVCEWCLQGATCRQCGKKDVRDSPAARHYDGALPWPFVQCSDCLSGCLFCGLPHGKDVPEGLYTAMACSVCENLFAEEASARAARPCAAILWNYDPLAGMAVYLTATLVFFLLYFFALLISGKWMHAILFNAALFSWVSAVCIWQMPLSGTSLSRLDTLSDVRSASVQ